MELEARGYANRCETKTSGKGKVYSKFSLGVKQKEKAWGDKPESVTWANFEVTDFSGQPPPDEKAYVTVKGYLKVREYVKDGVKRQSLEITATNVDIAEPLAGNAPPAKSPSGAGPAEDEFGF